MKHYMTKMICASMLMFALASCGTTKNEGNDQEEYIFLSENQRSLVSKNNAFAYNLFKEMKGMNSQVVSPLSVSYLMGMLANGADGQTKEEIMKTIGCQGVSLTELNAINQLMMQKAGKIDEAVDINIANYIAINKTYKPKSAFVSTMKTDYLAGVEQLDFTSPKTLGKINGWCKEQTHGMIPKIIDQVEADAVSYWMNAIYFNGSWAEKFDKKDTKEENFRGYTRDIKKVQMMHRNDKYLYANNDVFSALNMPYGNGSYSMTLLLPHEGKTIEDMMKQLDGEKLTNLRYDMENCIVDLKLPRFTIEQELTLNDIIAKLGAPSLFAAGEADFSNFAEGSFYVSKMLQKAKIEVSEEGTKAAAVTAAIMVMASLNQEEPQHVEFHANRPFVYMITEANTGAIFFIGQFVGE